MARAPARRSAGGRYVAFLSHASAAGRVAVERAAAARAAAAEAAAGNAVSSTAVKRAAVREWNEVYASTWTATGARCTGDGGRALQGLPVGGPFSCHVPGSGGMFTDAFGQITSRPLSFTLTL